MKFPLKSLAILLAAVPLAAFSQEATLSTINVTAPVVTSTDSSLGASSLNEADIASKRSSTSDTTRLLQDIPGVSMYGAGGVSSLPVIHGMADERLNVQVNGMGLMPACPNHMNSPLSYIDPTNVDSVKVYAGVTPVSVGGDSIGGSIQVESAPPKFAGAGQGILLEGEAGTFFRSNGNAHGENVSATIATENLNMTYSGSTVQSDNYRAAQAFHPAGSGKSSGEWLDGDVVGSTAYTAKNQNVGIALRNGNQLLQLNVGVQNIPYEGFPDQRMDLTENIATIINLGFTSHYEWGDLEARIYDQHVNHTMDMGPDRNAAGFPGMPMDTNGKVLGTKLQGNILLSEKDTLRVGVETQNYTLYDWWTPVGGQMGPTSLWNIDYGQRNKVDLFSEWESHWDQKWVSLLGVRSDTVKTDTGPVQGYSGEPLWAADAAAFNALDHQRTFNDWDMTALQRYTPDTMQTFEVGYAQKTRAPSLYQLYPWSTQPMATVMNNFAGDGNGYVGNLNLQPEVAHTFSASGDWHDAGKEKWDLKATGYYTYVHDYIYAQRCNFSNCGSIANLTATTGFVNLQYVNQTAQLYGIDVSGHMFLGKTSGYGSFTGTAVLSYVRGEDLTTGDNLYNMMPLNTKLAVVESLGVWTNTAEVQLVAAKTHVSQVVNEVPTTGYGLFNLRSSSQLTKKIRIDFDIENVLNRYYEQPLGGAYVGQGNTMALNTMPWGVNVPGMGRSVNVALSVRF